MHPNGTSKKGSALLLTLLITSLLMMIVLSLTVQVRLGLREAENRMDRHLARKNAKLSLHLALNQLQKSAGPDQRASARAEIIGVTGGGKYWTGIWKDNGTGSVATLPQWLVSGTNPDPVTPGTFQIFPSIEGDAGVLVEKEPLIGKDGSFTGELAYWISDEGVKVSLAKVDPTNTPSISASMRGLNEEESIIAKQVSPGRPRKEFLMSPSDSWDSLNEEVLKTSSIDDFVLLGIPKNDLNASIHQVTWQHLGVISNPESGGLKQDLSFTGSSLEMDDLSSHPNFQDWLSSRSTSEGTPLKGAPSPIISAGEPVSTHPIVLTEFGLYFRFSRNGNQNSLRLQMAARVEFWNPNSVSITFPENEVVDLNIQITGLPELECTWTTGTSSAVITSGNFTIDPNTTNFNHADDPNSIFTPDNIPVDVKLLPLDPGVVYRTTTRAEVPIGITFSDSTGINTDDYIEIIAPESEVTVRVTTPNGQLIQEFTNIPFAESDTTGRRSANDDLSGRQVNSRGFDEFQIVYYFRMDDETPNELTTGLSPSESWFRETDPRSLYMPTSTYNDSVIIPPPDEAALSSLFQSFPDLFAFGFRYYPAYDIPTLDPISIGSLQHLQFAYSPPSTVGNTWGNNVDAFGNSFNSYFDRYFFSTVPQTETNWQPAGRAPLANTYITPAFSTHFNEDLSNFQSPFSSIFFINDGSLNLNSVDPEIWQAILGSNSLTEWEYKQGITDIQYGIFRLPMAAHLQHNHPSEDLGQEYPNNLSSEAKTDWFRDNRIPFWANAYRLGIRELSQTEIMNLSDEITKRLIANRRPFLSMNELLNSGLIQDAIDETTINSTNGGSYTSAPPEQRIPFNSPSFVTQADVAQLLAPFAQTRSDTFIIRAYGSSSLDGTTFTEQMCEVKVQRIPEPVSLQGATTLSDIRREYINPSNPFGRRFRIISFKWLDDEVKP